SRRRHTRSKRDWSSDVCSSDLEFVVENNINVIITSGMGQGAVDGLAAKGIKSFSGVAGDPEKAVMSYLDGTISDMGANCAGHGRSEERRVGKGCGHRRWEELVV